MPELTYKAIDKYGKEKKGNITLDTMEKVYEKLRADGMTPVEVSKATIFTKEINIEIGNPVKPRELSVFCRQFTSMLRAGVTIIDSLEMLSEQTENKALAKAMAGVRAEIGKGETLAIAMGKYPKIFPSLMVNMVSAGEASGKLEVALERMASHFEKSAKMQGMVKKAAMYPIMVCIVAVVVVVVMLIKVIPAYQDMFEQMGTELPVPTKMAIAMSDFIIHRWLILILIIAAAVFGFVMFKRSLTGQIFLGKLSRVLPVFGKLNVKTAASNFSRTLSTLIYSGLAMPEALALTATTLSNYIYKKKVEEIREEVMRGIPISEPLLRDDLFPSMVGHMAKIGEETGDLEGMLNRLSDYYDEEVEIATATAMDALQPMIMLVLTVVVGFIIMAVMSPMLAMYQNMDNL